jgi:glycosyltransferase involved in cell wall biosynthesis
MKILMFSADSNILDARSAAAKRMIEYGKRVEKLDILVLTPHLAVGPPSKGKLAENMEVRALTGRFLRFFKAFFRVWKMLKREKYDLLVAQDIEHAFISWLLAKSLRGFKVKWQMQIHTDIFSPYFVKHSVFNKARVILARFLIPRASCVRAVSERIKKSLFQVSSFKFHGKIFVLPILTEFVDANIEPKRFPEFTKIILMVSRLTAEKNIGLAIDAMSEIIKKYPKTGLIIVGAGPEKKNLEFRILNLKLNNNIKIVGWQKDPRPYYKGADIFILTSWYEGWGMSVIEAMRYGAAVVMSDVGLARDLVEDGKSGLIVPVNDKNAFIAAILRLFENDGFRHNLAEAATKKIAELPSAEEYYKKIVENWKSCREFDF